MWGQLIVYQLLRTAMVDAVETRAGLDPDRASFTIALEAARDSVLLAHTPASHTPTTNPLGAVGRAVLGGRLPPRRLRTSARSVKAGRTRYPTRPAEPRPRQTRTITNLAVTLRPCPAIPPQPHDPCGDQRKATSGIRPAGAGNRNRAFHLMSGQPDRAWRPREVATTRLRLNPARATNLLRALLVLTNLENTR